MKVAERRAITFYIILFVGDWSRGLRSGRLFTLLMASASHSRGRDGALRRPRRVQRCNVGLERVLAGSFRPLIRGRGHRSAMSLPGVVIPVTPNARIHHAT